MPKKKSVNKKDAIKTKDALNRHIWHDSFKPALTIALTVMIMSYFVEYFSGSGILMLSGITASMTILTHKYRHHLTTLGNITFAYVVGSFTVIILTTILKSTPISHQTQVFIILLSVLGVLYALDLFHPPALSFAMSYMIFLQGLIHYLIVLGIAIGLFIAVRAIIYTIYEHLNFKDFVFEFIKEEEEIIKKEKRLFKRELKKI